MSSDPDTNCAANSKSDALGHVSGFKANSATPFARALWKLFPADTPHAQMVEFFQHRTTVQTIRQWRYGRRNPPQWAIDLVRAYGEQIAQLAAQSRVSKLGDPRRFKRR